MLARLFGLSLILFLTFFQPHQGKAYEEMESLKPLERLSLKIIRLEKGPLRNSVQLIEEKPLFKKVILDCQSFLHGISFDDQFFLLYENECYEIHSALKEWLSRGHSPILNVDLDFQTWSLEKGEFKSHD